MHQNGFRPGHYLLRSLQCSPNPLSLWGLLLPQSPPLALLFDPFSGDYPICCPEIFSCYATGVPSSRFLAQNPFAYVCSLFPCRTAPRHSAAVAQRGPFLRYFEVLAEFRLRPAVSSYPRGSAGSRMILRKHSRGIVALMARMFSTSWSRTVSWCPYSVIQVDVCVLRSSRSL